MQSYTVKEWIRDFEAGKYDTRLAKLYADDSQVEYQRDRYVKTLTAYRKYFDEDAVSLYSAPGRTELGGNHTDHQRGEVLAAAINRDAIAAAAAVPEPAVTIVSEGYEKLTVSLQNLERRKEEAGNTKALIRGVLAGIQERGYRIGGFQAYVTSDVLVGAGLSSSAAYETLIGTIVNCLYNAGKIPAMEIAEIGKYAENIYFGKPCGLMDQAACSLGGLVHIDFAKENDPKTERIDFDMNRYGYSLCITDTKGSHADLTEEYAAVPSEMKRAAEFFGKDVLREVNKEMLFANLKELRDAAGDRAVLRTIHFITENARVQQEKDALKKGDMEKFLALVKASGASSFQYLQNIYTNTDVQHQNVSVALAVSELYLGENGVCRVHGGGFAGTIQAYVKNEITDGYRALMDSVFGAGASGILKIRNYGGVSFSNIGGL